MTWWKMASIIFADDQRSYSKTMRQAGVAISYLATNQNHSIFLQRTTNRNESFLSDDNEPSPPASSSAVAQMPPAIRVVCAIVQIWTKRRFPFNSLSSLQSHQIKQWMNILQADPLKQKLQIKKTLPNQQTTLVGAFRGHVFGNKLVRLSKKIPIPQLWWAGLLLRLEQQLRFQLHSLPLGLLLWDQQLEPMQPLGCRQLALYKQEHGIAPSNRPEWEGHMPPLSKGEQPLLPESQPHWDWVGSCPNLREM
jgi:hypothetical protein